MKQFLLWQLSLQHAFKKKNQNFDVCVAILIWKMKSKLSSQAAIVFAWSSEKHVVLCYPDGRLCFFSWLILEFSSASFSWSNWEQYLLELFGFPEGVHNRGQSHHIHITFFVWRSVLGAVGSGSLHLPHDLSSMPHPLFIIHFNLF